MSHGVVIPNNVGLIKFYCINNPETKGVTSLKKKKKKKATSGEYSDASHYRSKALCFSKPLNWN